MRALLTAPVKKAAELLDTDNKGHNKVKAIPGSKTLNSIFTKQGSAFRIKKFFKCDF